VKEDAQGRLVIAGHQRTGAGRYDQLVVRMSANGVLDAGFAVGGYLLENLLDDARAVVLDDQGRIVVGGLGRNAFGLHISRHLPN
jgi:DNA-binding transcriptional regulator/RsmH inhibitor MraZ